MTRPTPDNLVEVVVCDRCFNGDAIWFGPSNNIEWQPFDSTALCYLNDGTKICGESAAHGYHIVTDENWHSAPRSDWRRHIRDEAKTPTNT